MGYKTDGLSFSSTKRCTQRRERSGAFMMMAFFLHFRLLPFFSWVMVVKERERGVADFRWADLTSDGLLCLMFIYASF
jgi:hypothetical protein